MYEGYFDELVFPKTGREVVEKGEEKLRELREKIAQRRSDIRAEVKKAGLEDSTDILVHLDNLDATLMSTESVSSEARNRVRHLLGKLRQEKKEEKQLRMVTKNLPLDRTFELRFAALQYFGF